MSFCIGVDLGEMSDYTAVAVVERLDGARASGAGERPPLHLRHLERYPLRTPYHAVADRVKELVNDPRLASQAPARERQADFDDTYGEANFTRYRKGASPLVMGPRREAPEKPEVILDCTGVGGGVRVLFQERDISFRAVIITGGDTQSAENGFYRVPKRDLVTGLEISLQNGILKVAEGLPLWEELREEMQNFRRKINIRTGHDSYEHWREADHDDMVLAVCLACWGTMKPRKATVFSF